MVEPLSGNLNEAAVRQVSRISWRSILTHSETIEQQYLVVRAKAASDRIHKDRFADAAIRVDKQWPDKLGNARRLGRCESRSGMPPQDVWVPA